MNDFLSFRKMITPVFIQVIFWLGVALIVLGALFSMAHSFLSGLVMLIVGPLIWRIYCEIVILFFKMHEELALIRGAVTGSAPGGFPVTPVSPMPVSPVPPAPPQY